MFRLHVLAAPTKSWQNCFQVNGSWRELLQNLAEVLEEMLSKVSGLAVGGLAKEKIAY
jgi:hypothetical protein